MYNVLRSKKADLDKYRPLPMALVKNLDDWFKVELTYTSNAIEGNTLTRQETALVIEKGLTVRGKSLSEHMEAHNHAKALKFVKSLVEKPSSKINRDDILEIHRLILQGNDDANTGRYRNIVVRIAGSEVVLPNYIKVPKLMLEFVTNTFHKAACFDPVELATIAHYELVTIHPFVDGNGRTARLLMNLVLLQNGYPPAIISKRQRERYITSLEQAQLGGSRSNFDNLIAKSVEKSLDIYLKAAKGEDSPRPVSKQSLLKIGELAKLTGQSVPTIRYWTHMDLLSVASKTEKGYSLYDKSQIQQVRTILALKAERYSLNEIKRKINST
ncbi:MAG: Fic family protein [Methylococcaceae bacterium]